MLNGDIGTYYRPSISRLQNYPRVTRKLFYVGIARVENTIGPIDNTGILESMLEKPLVGYGVSVPSDISTQRPYL